MSHLYTSYTLHAVRLSWRVALCRALFTTWLFSAPTALCRASFTTWLFSAPTALCRASFTTWLFSAPMALCRAWFTTWLFSAPTQIVIPRSYVAGVSDIRVFSRSDVSQYGFSLKHSAKVKSVLPDSLFWSWNKTHHYLIKINKTYLEIVSSPVVCVRTLGSVGSQTQLSLRCNLMTMYWKKTTCFDPWRPSSGCLGST